MPERVRSKEIVVDGLNGFGLFGCRVKTCGASAAAFSKETAEGIRN